MRGDQDEILDNDVHAFPDDPDAIRRRGRRISFEPYIYDAGAVAEAVHDGASPRGGTRRRRSRGRGRGGRQPDGTRPASSASSTPASRSPRSTRCSWYAIEEVNYRTHRKILVADGDVGFTGGAGVGRPLEGQRRRAGALARHAPAGHGPGRHAARGRLLENWAESAAHAATRRLDLGPAPPETRARSLVAWSSPSGGSNARELLLPAQRSPAARRTLDLQSAVLRARRVDGHGRCSTRDAGACASACSSRAT